MVHVIRLRRDVSCIVLDRREQADMAQPNIPPQNFGPSSALDTLLRYVDLSEWFDGGDAPEGAPTAAVLAITGDENPLTVADVGWDTGQRRVFVAPFGQPCLSTGPRIVMTVAGGSKGNTYTILVTWADAASQTVQRPVYQAVQWDAAG